MQRLRLRIMRTFSNPPATATDRFSGADGLLLEIENIIFVSRYNIQQPSRVIRKPSPIKREEIVNENLSIVAAAD